MRLLRALFNFAIHQYQTDDGVSLVTVNPVKFLSHVRGWYRIERRQSVIKSHQLADWHEGIITKQLSSSTGGNVAGLFSIGFIHGNAS